MGNFKPNNNHSASKPIDLGEPLGKRGDSRMGNIRQPPLLGIKMDRINNRIVINDNKILSLINASIES